MSKDESNAEQLEKFTAGFRRLTGGSLRFDDLDGLCLTVFRRKGKPTFAWRIGQQDDPPDQVTWSPWGEDYETENDAIHALAWHLDILS